MRLYFVNANMSEALIDGFEHRGIGKYGCRSQLFLGIFSHPYLRKCGKFHRGIEIQSLLALLLEKHHHLLQFLLDLSFGHIPLGHPRFCASDLFAVDIVPTRNPYLIDLSPFTYRCHRLILSVRQGKTPLAPSILLCQSPRL